MTKVEIEELKRGGRWYESWLVIGWRAAIAYQCGAI
jgi:hypothetical protein